MSYRFTGNAPTAVFVDGVAFPVDPQRVYPDTDLVVRARPELFIRSASDDASAARVKELEAIVAALTADLDEHIAFSAEVLAEDTPAAPVEAASAAPGEKRTVARRAR
jgi:hypothetical protein